MVRQVNNIELRHGCVPKGRRERWMRQAVSDLRTPMMRAWADSPQGPTFSYPCRLNRLAIPRFAYNRPRPFRPPDFASGDSGRCASPSFPLPDTTKPAEVLGKWPALPHACLCPDTQQIPRDVFAEPLLHALDLGSRDRPLCGYAPCCRCGHASDPRPHWKMRGLDTSRTRSRATVSGMSARVGLSTA
jgi:hypothetical protein